MKHELDCSHPGTEEPKTILMSISAGAGGGGAGVGSGSGSCSFSDVGVIGDVVVPLSMFPMISISLVPALNAIISVLSELVLFSS